MMIIIPPYLKKTQDKQEVGDMTPKTRRVLMVLRVILTNRVTYRFLAACLLAAGVTAGVQWVDKLETLVCSVVTQCN